MAWKSRKHLRKVFDRELATFPRGDVLELAHQLRKSGRTGASAYLHSVRGGAIALLQLGLRTRKRDLTQYPASGRLLMRWAAVAWAARTLILIETLERANAELDAPDWDSETALHHMDCFEGEEFWLWPFPYESPFPDEYDDNPLTDDDE